MNKKTLWIGILVIVVLGLVVVGKNSNKPTPAPLGDSSTAADTAGDASDAGPVQSAAKASQPAPKAPPKAVAKPQNGIAAANALPEAIMLDTSTDFARTNQYELEPYLTQAANFDNFYVVAKWQCGNNCQRAGVLDKRNGKAYVAPSDSIRSKHPGPNFVPYAIDSNLYRVINDQNIETYSFDGSHFTLISSERF